MERNRVVVTGLGMISPLGLNVPDTWDAILRGQSGAAPIEHFDTSEYATKFSTSVKNFDVTLYMSAKDARKYDPFIQFGLAAGIQAMEDSGLDLDKIQLNRAGCVVGSGIGGLGSIVDTSFTVANRGPRKVSPFFVPGSIANMIGGTLSIKYGFKGSNLAVTTACTTGTHAIGLAAREIAHGYADVMLAGGAEMATTTVGVAGFGAARALSTRNDEPTKASRPWDKGRDGFVLGDGAGVVILEKYEHAVARGANIYAELIGFGMSSDAFHITSPPRGGEGASLSMENAIGDAGIAIDDVDYINAHGTSTQVGDLAESQAVKRLFGDHAYSLIMSSTKSMTGHLLGAAGAVEAIFSVLSIREQVAPPTINLDEPDDECDLNYAPHSAEDCKIDVAMSNSFGFGGTNGTLIFKKI